MKKIARLTLATVVAALTFGTSIHSQNKSTPIEVKITGKTDHEKCVKGQRGTVTFNRFPATVKEFEEVREKIGSEPHGAVALQVMAYEMFRRNKETGSTCIELNSVSNITGPDSAPIRQLSILFNEDNSAHPYQMASMLKGATPENGYNPIKPYTIEVYSDHGRGYEKSQAYQATVVRMYVVTSGRSDRKFPVSVVKTLKPDEPSKGKYFIVTNSPIYSRVQEKSFAQEFKGLE
ncbi:hypothetical protein [Porphyromonas sp.]|uniref:DUF6935 domain-containing protein n=1 Tax=Porphyromonas sp. TaxID=1924944 RepID=UPI0026DD4FA1|nr:hypothetical protein [Porphyromonas sp.]MDO4771741.1 hypothetical protein [Porphyromonas sp.]